MVDAKEERWLSRVREAREVMIAISALAIQNISSFMTPSLNGHALEDSKGRKRILSTVF